MIPLKKIDFTERDLQDILYYLRDGKEKINLVIEVYNADKVMSLEKHDNEEVRDVLQTPEGLGKIILGEQEYLTNDLNELKSKQFHFKKNKEGKWTVKKYSYKHSDEELSKLKEEREMALLKRGIPRTRLVDLSDNVKSLGSNTKNTLKFQVIYKNALKSWIVVQDTFDFLWSLLTKFVFGAGGLVYLFFFALVYILSLTWIGAGLHSLLKKRNKSIEDWYNLKK